MDGPNITKAAVLGASIARKTPVAERFSHAFVQPRAEALLAATEKLDKVNPADLDARLNECRAINKALAVSLRENPPKDPRVIYHTGARFTVNACLRSSDEAPKPDLTARLSPREAEIRASVQAQVSRLKTDHDRKVFVVALRWHRGKTARRQEIFRGARRFLRRR